MKHQALGLSEKEEYEQRGSPMYDNERFVTREIGKDMPEGTIKRSSTHMREDWDGMGTTDWVMVSPMKGGLTDVHDRLVNLCHKARDMNIRTVRIYEHLYGLGASKHEEQELTNDSNGLLRLIGQRLTLLEALMTEASDRVEDIAKSIA